MHAKFVYRNTLKRKLFVEWKAFFIQLKALSFESFWIQIKNKFFNKDKNNFHRNIRAKLLLCIKNEAFNIKKLKNNRKNRLIELLLHSFTAVTHV